MILQNHSAGFLYFKRLLVSQGYQLQETIPFNYGRHELIKTDKGNFYAIFKRDLFMTFSYKFPELMKKYPSLNGAGESVNVESLYKAKDFNATLIIIYEDRKVYYYPNKIEELITFCASEGLVREQDKYNKYTKRDCSGNHSLIQEKTFSFPIRLLVRWE